MPGGAVRHQGVPPPRPPPLGDAVALQNEVRHAEQAEMLAHRDAGLTAADDENLDLLARHLNLQCFSQTPTLIP